MHIVFLYLGGGPGQDSCTECQLAAFWKGKAKEGLVSGDLLFQAMGINIYKEFSNILIC